MIICLPANQRVNANSQQFGRFVSVSISLSVLNMSINVTRRSQISGESHLPSTAATHWWGCVGPHILHAPGSNILNPSFDGIWINHSKHVYRFVVSYMWGHSIPRSCLYWTVKFNLIWNSCSVLGREVRFKKYVYCIYFIFTFFCTNVHITVSFNKNEIVINK